MGGAKAPEAKDEPARGERRLDAQGNNVRAVAAPRLLHGPANPRERLAQRRLELPADDGRFHAAPRSAEERHADLALPRIDLVTDRRMGDVQLRSSPGQTAMPGRRLKGAESVQRWQTCDHVTRKTNMKRQKRSFVRVDASIHFTPRGARHPAP